jgi:hypothetical protein
MASSSTGVPADWLSFAEWGAGAGFFCASATAGKAKRRAATAKTTGFECPEEGLKAGLEAGRPLAVKEIVVIGWKNSIEKSSSHWIVSE